MNPTFDLELWQGHVKQRDGVLTPVYCIKDPTINAMLFLVKEAVDAMSTANGVALHGEEWAVGLVTRYAQLYGVEGESLYVLDDDILLDGEHIRDVEVEVESKHMDIAFLAAHVPVTNQPLH